VRMKKIHAWEPWVFIFFGLFHLHRIWALFDRASYASFWMGIMETKGVLYFLLMGRACDIVHPWDSHVLS
jgi:hypothetical protein